MEVSDFTLLNESINNLTSRITWLAAVFWAAFISIFGFSIYMFFTVKLSDELSDFRDADTFLEQAKYEKLFKISRRVLSHRPNNVQANWYIALCYYHKSNYSKATEYFQKTQKANPNWSEQVKPYLDFIESLNEEK
ncbi:tetratricopeptide repeat protein [Shewanella maritima]|uniref:tetratricopeptide repeat protein n=1 Tax=Shewanella maritima TaxID=2520507 RepID=UPI003735197E